MRSELEEMSFLLFNLCSDMNKNGLDCDEEFEVLLQWDEELKDSYNEIFEDEDENTDYSKYYKIYRDDEALLALLACACPFCSG